MSVRWEYAADLIWGRSHSILEPDMPWVDGGEDSPPHPSEVKPKRRRAPRFSLVASVPAKGIELFELPKSLRRDPVAEEARPASLLDDLSVFKPAPERKRKRRPKVEIKPEPSSGPRPEPKKKPRVNKPGKRFGKPTGVYGLIADDVLRQLHARHMAGESIRQIGREVWDLFGYASPGACGTSLSYQFKRLGLPRRERAGATAKSNRERHAGKRTCRFVSMRGQTCSRHPLTDSPYCAKHRPEVIAEGIAKLRAKEEQR